ncbi:microsomal triacylglycerol transfer protein [Pectinophora gossypiella]|uniref:microsomal triacylglycerol transfer protein n=1 Tax=Pectinophora gossypiella TaxID=13191 RepID=UPI00214E191C|nr:microsomal triacylglycerol transfer protein [Pectinophora gossypiella]
MELRMWAGSAFCLALLCAGALGAARDDFVRLWTGGALEYEIDSAAVVYPAAAPAQQAGWRLRARLGLSPLACAPDEALLQLEVRAPRLELLGGARGAQLGPSLWDAPAARQPFYVHWHAGAVRALLLPPGDPPALQDYRRAIASLLQFQIMDGERNETDASGTCSVLYETLSPLEFRKLKRACRWEGADEGAVESRRVTRYTLSAARDALEAVTAEEEHRLGAAPAAGAADAAVKARAWARLRRAAAERGACAPAAPGLRPALAALPAALDAVALPLRAQEEDDDLEEAEAEERWAALAAAGAELQDAGTAGQGGTEHVAQVALRALEAARLAGAERLTRVLQDQDTEAKLVEVARIVGAAGTEAAHEAACGALQLRGGAATAAALAYLAALAGAAPPPPVLRDLLRLADDARDPGVAAAALLAAAAGVRADDAAGADDSARADVAAAVREHATRRLARCRDAACRDVALLALGGAAHPSSAALLLERAEAGQLEALRALRRVPAALGAARLHRVLELAADERRPLELRAQALELAVEHSVRAPLALTLTARRLLRQRGAAAGELRRVLWARLRQLAPQHEPVQQFLRAAAADPELGSWHAQAHPGTSDVVVRAAPWGGGGWHAELDAVTVASHALLRDAAVQLRLRGPAGPALPVLGVGLWTRGLQALAGVEGGEEGEDAAAGLRLTVGGAALPPLTLFTGQAELLSHVWAGSCSTATPALRALLPLRGGGAARLRATAAGALALDARAALALWARTAAARLRLRAALAARAAAALAAPWARAAAASRAGAAARLRVAADLDFYSAVALCVRVDLADHEYRRAESAQAGAPAARPHARRRRLRVPLAGRSLALGRANHAACRALPAAADDDDDDEP